MEKQFALAQNGQAPQQEDINQLGTECALADDRVLWELLKTLPYSATPMKGIMMYAKVGYAKETGMTSTALVSGNVANNSVRVMPFRAIVSSVDNSSELEKLRGARSGYLVGAATSYTTQAIAANSSGNPRWDLIYVSVTENATESANRYVKDPTTKIPSLVNVTINTKVTVSVNLVQGVPGASPARPALPGDAAGVYKIALAYVWVPNGFGAASIVLRSAIHEVAPILSIHPAAGGVDCAPGNQSYVIGGMVDTAQSGSTLAVRPSGYLPSTMVGMSSRFFYFQLTNAPTFPANNAVLDNSQDWRFRFFRWSIQAGFNASTNLLASDRAAGAGDRVPQGFTTPGVTSAHGMGQSFYDDAAGTVTPFVNAVNGGYVMIIKGSTMLSQIGGASDYVGIYVRSTDGALCFSKSGSPTGQMFVWIDATAPLSNFGTV